MIPAKKAGYPAATPKSTNKHSTSLAQFILTPLSKAEEVKISSDLDFLNYFIKFCHQHQFRVVVIGGYGLDGVIGKITRPHTDIDLVIYAQGTRDDNKLLITNFISQHIKSSTINVEPNPFFADIYLNSPGLGANVYIVETVHPPQQDILTIRKSNGDTITNNQDNFPPPVKAQLCHQEFEAQDPNCHLADIMSKRQKDTSLPKHDQDIGNLKLITNPKIVKKLLV